MSSLQLTLRSLDCIHRSKQPQRYSPQNQPADSTLAGVLGVCFYICICCFSSQQSGLVAANIRAFGLCINRASDQPDEMLPIGRCLHSCVSGRFLPDPSGASRPHNQQSNIHHVGVWCSHYSSGSPYLHPSLPPSTISRHSR